MLALSTQLLAAPTPLNWQSSDTGDSAPIAKVDDTAPGFSIIDASQSGIAFQNHVANERTLAQRGLLSGSGVAAGDIDGDGWCDLYFCGLDGANQLYRNLGNWQFEAVPPTGGIECDGTDATAAAFADVDGDRDLDLLVTASGNGVRLFLNSGTGTFQEATQAAGLRSQLGSMSMALADVDGDGDLDLYVANFRPTTIMDEASTRFSGRNINGVPTVTHVNGKPTTLPLYTNRFVISPSRKILELGQVDQLFLNDGHGHFTERSFTGGQFLDEDGKPLSEPPRDWGLAVQMRDFTGDGAPDIYVCNDLYTPDRYWVNLGDGRFQALPELALRNTSTFSMGADFADIDRDGDLDFFVVDMLSPDHRKRHVQVSASPPRPNPVGEFRNRQQILRNTLQLNLGDNSYAEISQFAGVEATDWSWGPIFLDVDLDGFEDILVTNGQLRDFQNVDHAMRLEGIRQQRKVSLQEFRKLINEYPNLSTPNFAFRNLGNLQFEDASQDWGFDQNGISQGMALADLDNDGDLDVIQNNLNATPTLLKNTVARPRIRVQLQGRAPNTAGIGARIQVQGGPQEQSQEIMAAGRYLSSDQAVRSFAARPEAPLTVTIHWRTGLISTHTNLPPNQLYRFAEPTKSTPVPSTPTADSRVHFLDHTKALNHQHRDEPFQDMERQPLLPNRLSQAGPGATWTDLNDDGWEDLLITTGRGGTLAAFLNQEGKTFEPVAQSLTRRPAARDQTMILPWTGETPQLLLASSNYEDAAAAGDAISLLDWTSQRSQPLISAGKNSLHTLAAADLDQDGDLDLFAGGRVIPGRYPQPVDSIIYENRNGTLAPIQTLSRLGLVTSAVFTDLDGDGNPELVVALEWGSLQVFAGTLGAFTNVSENWKLKSLTGWWQGLAAGDFNGDGRLDLVATNWGRNHRYRLSPDRPLKLYYGDFNNDQKWDLIESYRPSDQAAELPIRSLRTVGLALPPVRQHLRSFQAYANADLPTIYPGLLDTLPFLTANHLEHTVFLNQGSHFKPLPLPQSAQLAPAFGVTITDFDADGHEDLFLAQNFFATAPGTHRYDAGRGLILLGDGTGTFAPVPHYESGITIYGEQRAATVADWNHDGRADIAVTQNGQETRLFLNNSPRSGIRIELKGPSQNPHAIGAQLRVQSATHSGPTREIHAGSGWLSVDSPHPVLARISDNDTLWVRWPGGLETEHRIPNDRTTLQIAAPAP